MCSICRVYSSVCYSFCFFFSSRRRHTRLQGDWSSDVCSSDLDPFPVGPRTLFATPLWRHCLHGRWRLLYGRAGIKLTVNLILHCLVGQVHHPANARGQAIYHLLLEIWIRSEEHTSELQSPCNLVCRLLLEKKKIISDGAAGSRRADSEARVGSKRL